MKRGQSGLSLLVGVNKPSGLTSHDVVNRCRRIFGERRVGHTGTLDPLASGVLPICIGPATRLDKFLTGHDKSYRVTIGFGFETTTDDVEGEPTCSSEVDAELLSATFAEDYVKGLQGSRMQVPPRYSAIKINGKKAYELARRGEDVDLQPRPIEVYKANLASRYLDAESGALRWEVDFSVSKGTYIRALVRDMGRELGAYAHVVALERLNAGAIGIEDCVTLETLESLKEQAALDPVRALGFRFSYLDAEARAVENGSRLPESRVRLHEFDSLRLQPGRCCCSSDFSESTAEPRDGELVSAVVGNRLKAIYRYQLQEGAFASSCVFSTSVARG